MDADRISKLIDTARFGQNIEYLYEIDSTNEYAKLIANKSLDGTLVVADCQVSGKGRLGRNWNSPHDTGIFMSLIIKDNIKPDKAPMITIIAAMSVLKAVKEYIPETYIKWPNDIVVNGKKVCGILTEMKTINDATEYVIVGTGINVNTKDFPADIADKATSLMIETGKKIERGAIIAKVMDEFEYYYNEFIQTQNLALVMDDYNANLININNYVEIINSSTGNYTAKSLGIDKNGELLVQREKSDEVEKIISGEVSVRGVYGYV